MCYPWKRKKGLTHYVPMKKEECAICLGVIKREASACPSCKKPMHRMCFMRWKYSCIKRNVDFTCPMCRYIFTKY